MVFRRKTKQQDQPVELGQVSLSTIPESCLPGGEDAEAWQNAYADYLEAQDDDARSAAFARMEELGLETSEGTLVVT